MTLAHFEVVEVVSGRNLDGYGTLLGIGIFIGDDRNAAPDERQNRVPADEKLIARIIGMNRDARIAEHRLGPGGCNGDEFARTLDLIFEVPEVTLDLDRLHFEIRDGGAD